jgi:hypothetical protein
MPRNVRRHQLALGWADGCVVRTDVPEAAIDERRDSRAAQQDAVASTTAPDPGGTLDVAELGPRHQSTTRHGHDLTGRLRTVVSATAAGSLSREPRT